MARYSENDVDGRMATMKASQEAEYDVREGLITRRLRQIEKSLAELDEATNQLERRIEPTLTRLMEAEGPGRANQESDLQNGESGMSEQLAFIAERLQKRVDHIAHLISRVDI